MSLALRAKLIELQLFSNTKCSIMLLCSIIHDHVNPLRGYPLTNKGFPFHWVIPSRRCAACRLGTYASLLAGPAAPGEGAMTPSPLLKLTSDGGDIRPPYLCSDRARRAGGGAPPPRALHAPSAGE